MRRLVIITILLIFFQISIKLIFAVTPKPPEMLEIRVEPVPPLYAGNKYEIPIKIFHTFPTKKTIHLSIFPPYIRGISLYFDKSEIEVEPIQEKTVNLIVTVPEDFRRTSSIKFEIYAFFDSKYEKFEIVLTFIGKEDIVVKEYKLLKKEINPEEENEIEITLENLRKEISQPLKIIFEIENVYKKEDIIPPILPGNTYKYTHKFSLPKTALPGNYFLNVKILEGDYVLFNSYIPLTLKEFKSIEINKKVIAEFLKFKILIEVFNNGNTIESFNITEASNPLLIYFTSIKYSNFSIEKIDGKTYFVFKVENLKPLEKIYIEYEINWGFILLYSAILFVIIMFIIWYYFQPTILKKSAFQKDIYKITIIAKNNTNKRIKNVEIVDSVPNLFEVFNFSLEPIKEKVKGYTKLIWRFSKLEPKEEVIIFYNLKPKIEIKGEAKFKSPKMSYFIDGKKKTARKAILQRI